MSNTYAGLLLMLGSVFVAGTIVTFYVISQKTIDDTNREILFATVFTYYVGTLLTEPALLYGTSAIMFVGYAAIAVVAGIVAVAIIINLEVILFFLWQYLRKFNGRESLRS